MNFKYTKKFRKKGGQSGKRLRLNINNNKLNEPLSKRQKINTNFTGDSSTSVVTNAMSVLISWIRKLSTNIIPSFISKPIIKDISNDKNSEILFTTPESNKLCVLAKSDAKHDFVKKYNESTIKDTLPSNIKCIEAVNEDLFLKRYLQIDKDSNGFLEFSENSNIKHYQHVPIYGNNSITNILKGIGINEIYLIVDTYNDYFKNQLLQSQEQTDVTYFWIQNKQTIYDPAGKTTERTSAGKGLFKNNKIKFSWEKPEDSKVDIYPEWNETNVKNNINTLFYSKYNIYQTLSGSNEKNYDSACILEHDNNKYVYWNKNMAKKTAILKHGIVYSRDTKKFIGEIVSSKNPTLQKFVQKHLYIAKRLGDQGQALSCLKNSFTLYHRDSNNIIKKESNGNHCFVTIDRLAFAGAVLYNVPLIIYNYMDNKLSLFIRKDIIRPDILLQNIKTEYNIYSKKIEEFNTKKIVNLKEEFNIIYKNISYYLQNTLGKNIENETDYRNIIKELLKILNIIKLLATLTNISVYKPYDISTYNITQINKANNYLQELKNKYSELLHYENIVKKYINKNITYFSSLKIQNTQEKFIDSTNIFGEIRQSSRIIQNISIVSYNNISTGVSFLNEIYNSLLLFDKIHIQNTFSIKFIDFITDKLYNIYNISKNKQYTIKMINYIKTHSNFKINLNVGGEYFLNKDYILNDYYMLEDYLKTVLVIILIAKDNNINFISDNTKHSIDLIKYIHLLEKIIFGIKNIELNTKENDSEIDVENFCYIDFIDTQIMAYEELYNLNQIIEDLIENEEIIKNINDTNVTQHKIDKFLINFNNNKINIVLPDSVLEPIKLFIEFYQKTQIPNYNLLKQDNIPSYKLIYGGNKTKKQKNKIK